MVAKIIKKRTQLNYNWFWKKNIFSSIPPLFFGLRSEKQRSTNLEKKNIKFVNARVTKKKWINIFCGIKVDSHIQTEGTFTG